MSYDSYSSEHYLTTGGWEATKDDLTPAIHVETWEKATYQGSGYGRESSTWRMLWRNPLFDAEQCFLLHEAYPFPERGKITSDLFKNL